MIRTACIAAALAGAVAAATPAAAEVIVRFGGRPPVYVAPRPVYVVPPPPVYVAPRPVYAVPPVYVGPRCRTVREKIVVRRPGPDVVKWRTIRRC